MTFNSLVGVAFTLVVIIIYALLRKRRWQNIFLLGASLFFYAYGEPILVVLLLLCILTSYYGGVLIKDKPKWATQIFWLSTSVVLCVLGVFKYFNFFVDSIGSLISAFGVPFQQSTLEIILPIGISFYTFQSVGYLADVYRSRHEPERDFVDYALFLAFFAPLVAGPIERANNLLDQIKQKRTVGPDDISAGLLMVAQGFVKKTVIADNVAPYADFLFARSELSSPFIILGCFIFAIQIYADFSGYTDIARGVSRIMGFRILLNFKQPYLAKSPTEFWRRWHITLSNWFRDYVYIPLGGNRKGRLRGDLNAFVTMTISGLWHGASLNFVIWGMFHGLALVVHRRWESCGITSILNRIPGYSVIAWGATMLIVGYGWLLFRITEWDLLVKYHKAFITDWSHPDLALLLLFQAMPYVLLACVVDALERYYMDEDRVILQRGWHVALPVAAGLMLVLLFGSETGGAFIYFKF